MQKSPAHRLALWRGTRVSLRKASDVFVECLEAEGVRYVFGIPGEETLDLNESLDRSSISFVPVRHEQGGAYMADVYGRMTGRAGVCLGTLGPGATNLVTGVADAFLDRAPMVALTGQAGLERMHKESHQYLDVLSVMRPVTKWNARVTEPTIVPEVVRKAFKVAEGEKPGATHLELPEDVMGASLESRPLPRAEPVRSEPPDALIEQAAEIICGARAPVALAGNGVVRSRAARSLRAFAHATGVPVAETFMGKGLLDCADAQALGAVGLQAGDYDMAGFTDADVVVTIGYDLVEHSPRLWNPKRDKTIIYLDTLSAEIDEHFVPAVELVGDLHTILDRLLTRCQRVPRVGGSTRLRDVVLRRFEEAKHDPSFPMQRHGCSTSSGEPSARVMCWSPTSACTSCGSVACSLRMRRTPSSSRMVSPAWGSRFQLQSRPSSSNRNEGSWQSAATAAF
jgi:acetolactate synthase-1/2/3 large subunit